MSTSIKARKKKAATYPPGIDAELCRSIGISPEQAVEFAAMASVPEHVIHAKRLEAQQRGEEFLASDIRKLGKMFAARDGVNGSSPTKSRRGRDSIGRLKADLYEIIERDRPMTCRQIFYRAVAARLIDKTEAEYKTTICRLLAVMRRDGTLPFDWIADNTRWMRKPRTHSGLASMLDHSARTYRRAIWDEQDSYVEIWLEKDALAGVLYDITGKWDVPLMVTRGYPSLSFIHSAAEVISAEQKPTYLYYFGDLDPSGVNIPQKVEEGIREMAPDVDLHFERVAVNRDQVEEMGLPTRPTKKTDSRSKNFDGESVEVDAIEPDELRRLCEECIVQHVDQDVYDRMKTVEEAERETLREIAERLEGAA
jgi:hypothetical protein